MTFASVRGDGPLVVSFPHSGTDVPPEIARRLRPDALALVDTDWYVDRLYDFAETLGASTLRANVSRYVVDLNRDPSGASLYPGRRTTGVCPVETFAGAPLYETGAEPSPDDIAARVATFWEPYHAELRALLARAAARHGHAVLIDGHSIRGRLPLLFEGELPDVNLGTNAGASCDAGLTRSAEAVWSGTPYSVVVNGRFQGGYITRHYGDPSHGVHALQIELNQRTYLADGSRTAWDGAKAAALGRALRDLCAAAAAWRPAKVRGAAAAD